MIRYTPETVPPVTNPHAYEPSSINRIIELKVTVMLDAVPGPWHEPKDIMTFIADHSYVQKVELIREQDDDVRQGIAA